MGMNYMNQFQIGSSQITVSLKYSVKTLEVRGGSEIFQVRKFDGINLT